MEYKVQFKPRSVKDLRRLPANHQRRLIEGIERLSEDLAGEVKKLTQFSPE